VFVTEVQAQFKVADDLYIIKKTKSTSGDMFVQESFEVKKTPHTVTSEDSQAIMNFFDLVALRKLKKVLDAFTPKE
jgi:hypothetical protein